MATRQYIGARYVPKFYQNSVDGSSQWESNVVYEPLMYVTLTNGHMYLSRKQVPATVGSPVDNIDYWLDIGSYNGFIEQLQGEIDTINDVTIPAIQGSVALKQDITDNSLETTSKTVVGAINEINAGLGNAASSLTNKQDKTDNTLTTVDKTVVGAINELDSDVASVSSALSVIDNEKVSSDYFNPSNYDAGIITPASSSSSYTFDVTQTGRTIIITINITNVGESIATGTVFNTKPIPAVINRNVGFVLSSPNDNTNFRFLLNTSGYISNLTAIPSGTLIEGQLVLVAGGWIWIPKINTPTAYIYIKLYRS